jgi:hypothetical protein
VYTIRTTIPLPYCVHRQNNVLCTYRTLQHIMSDKHVPSTDTLTHLARLQHHSSNIGRRRLIADALERHDVLVGAPAQEVALTIELRDGDFPLILHPLDDDLLALVPVETHLPLAAFHAAISPIAGLE